MIRLNFVVRVALVKLGALLTLRNIFIALLSVVLTLGPILTQVPMDPTLYDLLWMIWGACSIWAAIFFVPLWVRWYDRRLNETNVR